MGYCCAGALYFRGKWQEAQGRCWVAVGVGVGADVDCEKVQVSIGTSSSETASSDRGMSSTSSSEKAEEEEGDAERGRERGEGDGLVLKREMFIPREWKIEDREGLLGGGTVTGRLRDGSAATAGAGAGAGTWVEAAAADALGGGTGTWGVCGGACCCWCSLCDTRPAFWGRGWLVLSLAVAEPPGLGWPDSGPSVAAASVGLAEEELAFWEGLGAGLGMSPHLRRRRTARRTNRGRRRRRGEELLSCRRSCRILLSDSEVVCGSKKMKSKSR